MTRRLIFVVVGCGFSCGCAFDTGGIGGPGTGELEGGSGSATAEADTASAQGEGSNSASGEGGPTTQGDGSEGPADTTDAEEPTSTGEAPMPCADGGGCDVDASCVADPSGENAVCTCKAGFVGDGLDCAVAPQLVTLRVEAGCAWVAGVCFAGAESDQTTLVGEPGAVYRATLRVRGVVEQKNYNGGAQEGLWHPGGSSDGWDLWNSTTLSIAAGTLLEAQTIRLNSGSSGGFSLTAVDVTHDVFIETGAVVRLSIDPIDGVQIGNGDDLVIADIPPAPEPFDGQFLQIDAVAITPE